MTPRRAHPTSPACELALMTPYSQTHSPRGQGCAASWDGVEAGALEKSGGKSYLKRPPYGVMFIGAAYSKQTALLPK